MPEGDCAQRSGGARPGRQNWRNRQIRGPSWWDSRVLLPVVAPCRCSESAFGVSTRVSPTPPPLSP